MATRALPPDPGWFRPLDTPRSRDRVLREIVRDQGGTWLADSPRPAPSCSTLWPRWASPAASRATWASARSSPSRSRPCAARSPCSTWSPGTKTGRSSIPMSHHERVAGPVPLRRRGERQPRPGGHAPPDRRDPAGRRRDVARTRCPTTSLPSSPSTRPPRSPRSNRATPSSSTSTSCTGRTCAMDMTLDPVRAGVLVLRPVPPVAELPPAARLSGEQPGGPSATMAVRPRWGDHGGHHQGRARPCSRGRDDRAAVPPNRRGPSRPGRAAREAAGRLLRRVDVRGLRRARRWRHRAPPVAGRGAGRSGGPDDAEPSPTSTSSTSASRRSGPRRSRIYNSSSPEQVAYLAGHCRAKVAIVEDDGFEDRFTKVRDELPDLETHREPVGRRRRRGAVPRRDGRARATSSATPPPTRWPRSSTRPAPPGRRRA